jgi:hypothetical protein
MEPAILSLVSACTALVASVIGPFVTVTVAKRQIAASVVSTNRNRWIGELRDHVAELVSLFSAVLVVRSRWQGPWNRGLGALDANPALIEKLEHLMLVQWKIRLLLNPTEKDNVALHDAIVATFERIKSEEWSEAQMIASIETITHLTQAILKREWQRVKAGT